MMRTVATRKKISTASLKPAKLSSEKIKIQEFVVFSRIKVFKPLGTLCKKHGEQLKLFWIRLFEKLLLGRCAK